MILHIVCVIKYFWLLQNDQIWNLKFYDTVVNLCIVVDIELDSPDTNGDL